MPVLKFVPGAILACLLPLAGCADIPDDDVTANVTVIDRRVDSLTLAQIQSINGTYTSCTNHTGSWSLTVSGGGTLLNSPLAVIKGDTACTLAITSIRTTGNVDKLPNGGTIALGTSYGTARSFASPVEFYANAMLSSASYSADFTLTLLFSSDASVSTATKATSYGTVTATTVTATGVTAPAYTLDLSGITVTADINKLVTSVTGNVAVTGSATATNYVVVTTNSAIADTYDAIDTAYNAGSSAAIATAITGTSLLANGTNLTSGATRTIIYANISNGVKSYQKFTISFSIPT
ncbi:MAG: hypothetical protein JWN48_3764 [Myxococcaceae bacterium]|nr:hypothetical protein [Myxococcaceae bacterium]